MGRRVKKNYWVIMFGILVLVLLVLYVGITACSVDMLDYLCIYHPVLGAFYKYR